MTATIIVPTHIILPRKTKKDKIIPLTINWYRNAYFHESNTVKKLFKEIVTPQLKGETYKTPYWLAMTIYYKRTSDIDNWDWVISKFFNDCLVELWCVPDDNMHYFIEKHMVVWWQDKENPRVEITII